MKTRSLDTLFVKLFAAIAGAIAVLTLAAYVLFTWSFDRGFVQYVEQADAAKLGRMVERLEATYREEGGWGRLAADRERWIEAARAALGLRRGADPQPNEVEPRDLTLTIDPRLMLFDAERRQLVGRKELAERAVLLPVVSGAATVGYLGYVPRPELVAAFKRVYLQRQYATFRVAVVAMLIAALAIGAGLALWLTRRIRRLAAGANALMQGDYAVQVDERGSDEIAQLARDFNALASTLAAARQARQQWIADIAHELRTPLSILRGEIESLQDGVRPLDQRAVASLAAEAARLARLVEDLHTLSMSDLGALTYRKEPVPLAELIEEAIDVRRPAIAERGIAIEAALDETVVLADEARLVQVFANLLQNSLRYTDAPGRIRVATRRDHERVIVTWEDSAPGVPEAELSRLTERLYRVEGSRSREGGGSGLGLAIARAIVEAHGGVLTAQGSALGGLRVDVSLPVYRGGNGHE